MRGNFLSIFNEQFIALPRLPRKSYIGEKLMLIILLNSLHYAKRMKSFHHLEVFLIEF
jgi:hypothetical protein